LTYSAVFARHWVGFWEGLKHVPSIKNIKNVSTKDVRR